MKMMLVAGLIITLPAIVIAIYFAGHKLMLPALASLAVNSIPFIVAALIMRRSGGGDESEH